MTEILDVDTKPADTNEPPAPPAEPPTWDGTVKLDGAPDVVKNLLETKKWNTVEQIANGYKELEKFTGIGKHLVIPEAEDDAEGWNKVYNILGRPETYDKYVIEDDEVVPLEKELAEKWKQYAHGIGLTQKQMAASVQFQRDVIKGVMEAEAEVQAKAQEEEAQAKENVVQGLIKKLGGQGAYENGIRDARIVADNLGIYDTLKAKGLASDPEIIGMLLEIKNRTAEDVIHRQPPAPTKSPQDELDEIKKSPAFTNKFDPKHKEIMKRYMELCRAIEAAPDYKNRSR